MVTSLSSTHPICGNMVHMVGQYHPHVVYDLPKLLLIAHKGVLLEPNQPDPYIHFLGRTSGGPRSITICTCQGNQLCDSFWLKYVTDKWWMQVQKYYGPIALVHLTSGSTITYFSISHGNTYSNIMQPEISGVWTSRGPEWDTWPQESGTAASNTRTCQ